MKIALPLIVFAAALTLACHAPAVSASPALQKTGSPTPPVAPSAPYELKLSLISDFSSPQSDIPSLHLSLVNATPYALSYRWIPPRNVTFQIEYKAASDNPGKKAGWKRLMPVSTSVGPSRSGVVTESDEHVELERMSPGQEEELPNPSVPPALSKEGFYRITATLKADAGEFNGTVSRSTLVRSFKLVVSSKPLVIRRTATGFAEVPATASAAPAR